VCQRPPDAFDNQQLHAGGFGLGLALVRRVSQSHGGQVEVADSPWGGASFPMTWAHQD
jgi:two-component system sensor kinase ParS